ncbi:MAG: bifunctional riboflavin kinase/FAD synthetase [Lachnospiraceae bacterium]|nr:bifunctional riboflavin kinase/FAD synthetase [Lachnospiraceae bacterium]
MRIFTELTKAVSEEETVLALGKFDGIHLGHELLLSELLKEKEKGYAAAVIAFTMDLAEGRLSATEEKAELFERIGVDLLIECPFTEEIKHMEAMDFLRLLKTKLRVSCIVAADDVSFGYRRLGNAALLRTAGPKLQLRSVIVTKRKEEGRDISSTWIRKELSEGRIEHANRLLGYPYFLTGEVIHGTGLGKKFFHRPTLNLIPHKDKLLPPYGVYLTETEIGGRVFSGISNLGVKPTVSDVPALGLETHLLDYQGNLYGELAKTSFLRFLRKERKFSSQEELRAQIEEDTLFAKHYFGV